MKYSLVVPVFNSENTLPILKKEAVELFQKRNEAFEIIFVDDCSKDKSWEILNTFAGENNIRIIRLAKNFGQHSSTICGIRKARGEVIITIDDDLQYPIEEINKLIDYFEKSGKTLVFGIPKHRQNNYTSNLIYKLIFFIVNFLFYRNFRGKKFSSFAIFHKQLFHQESLYHGEMEQMDINHLWLIDTEQIGNIDVNHELRKRGKSNYNFIRVFRHIRFALFNIINKLLNLLLAFSFLLLIPLIIASIWQLNTGVIIFPQIKFLLLLIWDVKIVFYIIVIKYIFKEFLYKSYRTNYLIAK